LLSRSGVVDGLTLAALPLQTLQECCDSTDLRTELLAAVKALQVASKNVRLFLF
jgi:hypothetical protein